MPANTQTVVWKHSPLGRGTQPDILSFPARPGQVIHLPLPAPETGDPCGLLPTWGSFMQKKYLPPVCLCLTKWQLSDISVMLQPLLVFYWCIFLFSGTGLSPKQKAGPEVLHTMLHSPIPPHLKVLGGGWRKCASSFSFPLRCPPPG